MKVLKYQMGWGFIEARNTADDVLYDIETMRDAIAIHLGRRATMPCWTTQWMYGGFIR